MAFANIIIHFINTVFRGHVTVIISNLAMANFDEIMLFQFKIGFIDSSLLVRYCHLINLMGA